AKYEKGIPETILGSDFLTKYKTHDDPVTTVQPDATYRVVGPTRHPIGENERGLKFIAALEAAKSGDQKALVTAGGTGGTVAVFGKIAALKEHIPQIPIEYSRRVGEMPNIFEGTSPGAIEF